MNSSNIPIIVRNKYDYSLILMVTLLSFGGFGGSLQPIRVLSVLVCPFVIWFYIKNWNKTKDVKVIRSVFFLFLFLFISLLWTSDIDEGIKEVVYYWSHLCAFITIIALFLKSNKPINTLLTAWVVFIFITQIVAFNEIFFDKHFSLSVFGSDKMMNVGGEIMQKKFASVTFGNYNSYVTVILMSLPFQFASFALSESKKSQLILLSVIGFSYFILFINASRGGIVASLIILLVFILFLKKLRVKNAVFNMILVVPVFLFGIIRYFDVIFEQLLFRQIGGSKLTQDNTRIDLFTSALNAFYNKPFFGGGIGSLQYEMKGALILYPHNLFLEILVQFGIFITIFFLIYLFKHLFFSKNKDSISKYIIFSALLSLPIMSIIDSGYLLKPVLWVYLASLYCIAFVKAKNGT